MTVSGMTMIRAERHPDHNRENQTERHRSPGLSAGRFLWVRSSTVNGWRKAMFSACNAATKAGDKGTERYYDKVQHAARSLSMKQIQQFTCR